MSEEKPKLDYSITTVGDLLHALRNEKPSTQIYCHVQDYTDALIEITEVTKILPKSKDTIGSYIVLRAR